MRAADESFEILATKLSLEFLGLSGDLVRSGESVVGKVLMETSLIENKGGCRGQGNEPQPRGKMGEQGSLVSTKNDHGSTVSDTRTKLTRSGPAVMEVI